MLPGNDFNAVSGSQRHDGLLPVLGMTGPMPHRALSNLAAHHHRVDLLHFDIEQRFDGAANVDLIGIANEANKLLANCEKKIKVAIMGCAVNGPGEAKEADVGIAGGNGEGLLFKKGVIIKKVTESELLGALMDEIEKM